MPSRVRSHLRVPGLVAATLCLLALLASAGAAKTTSRGSSATKPRTAPRGFRRLAFDDEFNGSALNTTKWATHYARPGDMAYSNWSNGEAQWYKAGNVVERHGVLKLIARRARTRSPRTGRVFDYSSGMITSKSSFNFRYGYMEARMKLPKGSGFWPAFWTWPSNEQWPPEIDAIEFYGDNPTLTYETYHRSGGASGTRTHAPDWTRGWHTFAVDWEPGQLRWYIDGRLVKSYAGSPSLKMYLIANLAICNGARCPAPNRSTRFPSAVKLDYVRVWKR